MKRTLAWAIFFFLANGCIDVQKGAFTLIPDLPATDFTSKSQSPAEGPKTPSVDIPPIWASREGLVGLATAIATIVSVVGHRIYAQRKGKYSKS